MLWEFALLKTSVSLTAVVLWLAFSSLLFVSGYLLLTACDLGWGWLNYCKSPAQVTLLDIQKENRSLLLQRDNWLERINQAKQCVIPTPGESEPTDEETQIPEEELARCQVPPADDLLVVLDVSLSMGWDYGADPAILQQLDSLARRYQRAGLFDKQRIYQEYQRTERRVTDPSKPDRIDIARRALTPLVRNLPENTRLKLLSFAQCNVSVRNEGIYTSDKASEYEDALRQLRLRDSTALAAAIDSIPSQTQAGRSPDRPVNIVILSDGEDSCNGDPCAAAARLKQKLPHANVSVVSLAKTASANACIARATGGRFLEADDIEGLMRAVRQAGGQLSADECLAVNQSEKQGESSSEGKNE
ncbi:MAG: VWA domain-containing protein [Albidovulum sp.]|uniref:vWA domain-containing protein n=1 Tax=Albidovulum sp. TaxID=1872424 RepID=UPI003C9E8520